MNESKAHRSRTKPKSIEWISKVLVVTKPGKIRICLDSQELNKVIQRPEYLIPTLEELLPIVSCPKTEKRERWLYQITLYEAISKVFDAFFRYRHLRMPFGSLAPE